MKTTEVRTVFIIGDKIEISTKVVEVKPIKEWKDKLKEWKEKVKEEKEK